MNDSKQHFFGRRAAGLVMAAAGLLAHTSATAAALRLPAVISDHMVLQDSADTALWGWADPSTAVTAVLEDAAGRTQASATVQAAADGRWTMRLKNLPPLASGRLTITADDGEKKSIEDVAVGEVWLGGGQSNMSYRVGAANVTAQTLELARREAAAVMPQIRFFFTESNGSDQPRDDVTGSWKVATPDTVARCPAVPWYFGVYLQARLHCSVGLLVTAVAGTPAEAWMPRGDFEKMSVAPAIWKRHLEALSHYTPELQRQYDQDLAAWMRQYPTPQLQFSHSHEHPREPYSPTFSGIPSRLYNGKVRGLEPYTVKGVLWFQGDQNSPHPEEYPELIRTLIASWRRQWGAELPFYYVEINNMLPPQRAPVEPNKFSPIREEQNAALELPLTDVVSSIDLGIAADAHFPDKEPLGIRLARLALSEVYHRPMGEVHSPQFFGDAIEGSRVRLHFRYAAGLRKRAGASESGFAIRQTGGPWKWAKIEIQGEDILVWNDEVPEPSAVRYDWAANPIVSIENGAGLPLRPFRTDSATPLNAFLRPYLERHVLAGAVTLAGNADGVCDVETVGFADIAAAKPMREDTMFWIASMSKTFTAVGAMMLIDEGKLSVDDPVEKYIPSFRGRSMLVRHLLSHTSGLPMTSPAEKPTSDTLSLQAAADSYAKTPALFAPGAGYRYSNAGFNTIGRIIEIISGQPYDEFMADRLFRPLGMKDTTLRPSAEQIDRLAQIYVRDPVTGTLKMMPLGGFKLPLSDPTRQPMPAGGYFSTGADVAIFCQMMLDGGIYRGRRYLSQARIQEMTSKQTGPANSTFYGFGWDTLGNGIWVHAGGYHTVMAIDPNRHYFAVLMVQYGGKFPSPEGDGLIKGFVNAAAAAVAAR